MKTGYKSTLSLVRKGLTVNAPVLLGADLGTRGNQMYFFNGPNGYDYKFDFSNHTSGVKAYQECAPLTAIINKKAQAFVNGETWLMAKDEKGKWKEAKGTIPTKIRKLLSQPNPFQSQTEFELQQYIYTAIFGFCLMLPIKPVGFENYDATRLWNIPPNMVDIEETQKSWLLAEKQSDVIKKIVINFGGEKTSINADDVYIVKDITTSFDSIIFPDSRVKSLALNIKNIIGALISRGVLIDTRGAQGIISPDSKDIAGAVPLLDKDKIALQEEFLRYGLSKNQFKYIISNASVKFSAMGIPTKDLMLFEEIEDDIMRICDGYNYPYPLMASNRTNSLGGGNIDTSKALLYQDAIIPESVNFCRQLGRFFAIESMNLKFDKDFSKVPALQGDKVKEATARNILNDAKKKEFDAGLITLDQWLEALGEDPLPDGMGAVRSTDTKNNSVPLAVTIGVGGVEGLISVITAPGMSVEARQATLEIVFGLSPENAKRMSVSPEVTTTQPTA